MLLTDPKEEKEHKEKLTVEKFWLKSYPSGIPSEINPDLYQSLVQIVDESIKLYADLPAFYNLGVTLTFREIDQHSLAFAAYLQNVLRLRKGDRLAIMMPNILQYPVVLIGALRAGVTIVNINPLYTPRELALQLNDSGAQSIVVLANFARTVQEVIRTTPLRNVIITHIGDFFSLPKSLLTDFFLKYIKKKIPNWRIAGAIKFKDTLTQGRKHHFSPVDIKSDDIAFLQYTGGTTGIAKGAMLTHRNLIANILQADAWFGSLLEKGKESVITALPLYHIFSLTANCFYIFHLGGFNILITNPRDLPHMVDEMSKFKFSIITGVNTLFNALLNNQHFAHLDFRGLKLSLGGGMAIQKNVAERWQKVTGQVLLEAYGLTETSPCVAINPTNIKEFNGTVGLPAPSTNICILNDEGHSVPIGQAGELAIKGPQVMLGYWNNPRETNKVFTDEGWLLTGDIASINEEGFLKILERKKDMILVSGFNVYPNEIEDVLVRIPGIVEAAVIGIPDEHAGESIKAFIVKNDPELTESTIINFCRENLTGYKIPKQIEFRNELPKSNVGKILRRALR